MTHPHPLDAAVREIDIVFDGPPDHESGRFVEVESPPGTSISFGEWVHRDDGYWVLRFKSALSRGGETTAPPPAAHAHASELEPCPFCGGVAEFGEVAPVFARQGTHDDGAPINHDYGGHFVCCKSCGASTNLVFPLKEDVREVLAEKWNRRITPAPPLASQAAYERRTTETQLSQLDGFCAGERFHGVSWHHVRNVLADLRAAEAALAASERERDRFNRECEHYVKTLDDWNKENDALLADIVALRSKLTASEQRASAAEAALELMTARTAGWELAVRDVFACDDDAPVMPSDIGRLLKAHDIESRTELTALRASRDEMAKRIAELEAKQ